LRHVSTIGHVVIIAFLPANSHECSDNRSSNDYANQRSSTDGCNFSNIEARTGTLEATGRGIGIDFVAVAIVAAPATTRGRNTVTTLTRLAWIIARRSIASTYTTHIVRGTKRFPVASETGGTIPSTHSTNVHLLRDSSCGNETASAVHDRRAVHTAGSRSADTGSTAAGTIVLAIAYRTAPGHGSTAGLVGGQAGLAVAAERALGVITARSTIHQ